MKRFIHIILKKLIVLYYHSLTCVLPVNKNKIVFSSNLGRNYSGNPKYIYEQFMKEKGNKQYKCVWFYQETPFDLPYEGIQVQFGKLKYLFHMATAKVWVFDTRQPQFLVKRKNTHYIQTWHGTPLKKLGMDLEDMFMVGESSLDSYKENFRKNVESWDYLISQNSYSSERFRQAFCFHKEMMEIGYPRNDVLFHKNQVESIKQSKQDLGLPLDKKIILYAPTWRDDEYNGLASYKFNPQISFDLLMNHLKDEYVMIVKYHYLVMDSIDWSNYKGFIYTFDNSYDIADLYLVSDMMITDYSSVMFDYSILNRPMLFYAYDLEKYKNNLRGFYFDFMEVVPGPVSRTTEQLIQDIKQYHEYDFKDKYIRFRQKFNHLDDGKASDKVRKLIEDLLK